MRGSVYAKTSPRSARRRDAPDRNGATLDAPRLKEGHCADVVVFDLATLDDAATYEAPRWSPCGIDYVLVNGQVAIDHGRHTGARPGQVLYGPGR